MTPAIASAWLQGERLEAMRYRHKAEELRAIAEDLRPAPRATLLRLADEYDGLARQVETFDLDNHRRRARQRELINH